MSGKIDLDDEEKFGNALRYAPNFRKLVVNLPGGSIVPAIVIGKGLRTRSASRKPPPLYEVSAAASLIGVRARVSRRSQEKQSWHRFTTFWQPQARPRVKSAC
jgi:hypothetical protein